MPDAVRLDKSSVLGWRIDHELKHRRGQDTKGGERLPPHLVSRLRAEQRMVNFSPLTVLMPGARHRSRLHLNFNLLLAGEVI